MKVLLVNAYAKSGGASVAMRRLCSALNGSGAEARCLVQNSEGVEDPALLATADCWAFRRPLLDSLPTLPWRNRRTPHWGNAWLGNSATRKAIRDYAPDVTHLHWVNHGMLSVRDIALLKSPVVWTLHDSWAFTGGCHSPQECRRFCDKCGHCPELHSCRENDLSRWNWKRKNAAWENSNFTVVTPSRWQAAMARSSSLLVGHRIETIPNAVDTSVFRPMERAAARTQLGLPLDAPIFLFGAHGAASDWNKGMDLWRASLEVVAKKVPSAIAVLVSDSKTANESFPLPVVELGVVSPERMARVMASADATVVPSRMENLPNMVAESLTCGTPVAAFAVGGIPEMIISEKTGLLATPHDPADLARCICELLARGDTMRAACSEFAQANYAPPVVVQQHVKLYRALLEPS